MEVFWRPEAILGRIWASQIDLRHLKGVLGASWERLGSVLGVFWSVLGASWERLGNILGPSWNILRGLGSDLGNLTAVFEMSWKVFCSLSYLLFRPFDVRPISHQFFIDLECRSLKILKKTLFFLRFFKIYKNRCF